MKSYAITGAASGIGRATAVRLARSGARVFALDLSETGLAAVASSTPDVTAVPVDLRSEASVAAAAHTIASATDGLDGLVNCAGLIRCGPLVEIAEEDVRNVLEVNLLGAYRMTRALFPLLRARRGRVVNVSSEAARISAPFNGPYSMSKFGLEAYSDSLRRELSLLGMQVVIVQPGATRTGLLDATVPSFDRALEASEFARPMRRIRDLAAKEEGKSADPDRVARAIERALTARWPRPRYRVGNDPFRRFVEFLPTRLADALIGLVMR